MSTLITQAWHYRDWRQSRLLDCLIGGDPFHNSTGNFSGQPGGPWRVGRHDAGWMPRPWSDQWYAAREDITYVIYSYDTPIAWRTERGWTVPPVSYSPTTAKHQHYVRTALDVYGDDAWPQGQEPIWYRVTPAA